MIVSLLPTLGGVTFVNNKLTRHFFNLLNGYESRIAFNIFVFFMSTDLELDKSNKTLSNYKAS